jgi:ribose-phosphate pyrophosphokinase
VEGRLQVFAGNSNPRLACAVTNVLEVPLGRAEVSSWSDGETRVKLEENVRGSDVFVIQSLCSPVNQHVMELLIMLDAVGRVSAARITAVIRYYTMPARGRRPPGASRSAPSCWPTC